MAQAADVPERRGTVRIAADGIPRAGTDPQRVEPAAEALQALQRRYRPRQQLLRHSLGRRQHRGDQQRAHGVPEQVRNLIIF